VNKILLDARTAERFCPFGDWRIVCRVSSHTGGSFFHRRRAVMIPSTMKAARIHARGTAHFQIEDLPTPRPGPGQVLIRVESAGVNFSDVKRRRGDAYPFATEFPYVPGSEIAGTVVAHGPCVDGPPIGTPVFALAGANGYGGYAQFAVSYAQTAIPIPSGMELDVAAILLVAGATAKLMLSQAALLQAGQSLLVPAATGGVGSFTLQLARHMGAGMVIAAVGNDSKGEQALALGAHAVVNYTEPDWPSRKRVTPARDRDHRALP
jgi:NADPH:quinone reductase-like Zn-dependent oxidoreductase